MEKDKLYLEQWKVCIEAANRLETRRDNANKLFATVLSSMAAGYGFLFFQIKNGWGCLVLCILCIPIILIWDQLLSSFELLAKEKFKVINNLEKNFEVKPMKEEWHEIDKNPKYKKIVDGQRLIPRSFVPFSVLGIFFAILRITSVL